MATSSVLATQIRWQTEILNRLNDELIHGSPEIAGAIRRELPDHANIGASMVVLTARARAAIDTPGGAKVVAELARRNAELLERLGRAVAIVLPAPSLTFTQEVSPASRRSADAARASVILTFLVLIILLKVAVASADLPEHDQAVINDYVTYLSLLVACLGTWRAFRH
jgi:hypothetical protein